MYAMKDDTAKIHRPFRVLGIDHVVMRVTDIERALLFYRDVLGCEIERKVDEIGLVQLRAGGALIDLVDVNLPLGKKGGPASGTNGHNVDHICLQIENFENEQLIRYLRAQAIEVGDISQRYGANGYGPSLYITDPDGNTLELKGPKDDRA